MKFRYLGKNETMIAFGHDFSNGQTPDVTDEKAIKRLSTNHHFEEVKEADEEVKEADADAEKLAGKKDLDKDFPPLPGKRK